MIRMMNSEDISEVCNIEAETGVCEWGVSGYKEALEKGYFCLVYEEGSKVIGFIVMRVTMQEAEILNLAVKPEFMGCGIGSLLMDECKKIAEEKGSEVVWLEVRKSNFRAIKFYERHGFFKVFERKNFYSDLEDAVVMRCNLDVKISQKSFSLAYYEQK